MPFTKVIKDDPCSCPELPSPSVYGAGTEWYCDTCGLYWRVTQYHTWDSQEIKNPVVVKRLLAEANKAHD